ncbi:hypothetical protein HC028_04355 [Planosporangium flavigriseum]|nr:hypothetical protein [Planosporangium flavigriseum]NJC63742.1 hypothetical protein [Planosporangium flavigriseum]
MSAPTPAPTLPLPAAAHGSVRGRRVIIGLPGLGWRGDMRADSPVIQGSRTYVPVLAEQEWYRAEAEQIEAFAPMVPIERVWVEVVTSSSTMAKNGERDLISRLVSLDAPPRRDPVPARDAASLTGRRVITFSGTGEKAGHQRDLRAVTEPYASSDGDISVRVARELDWYRWAWSGNAPKTLEVPVHLLWLE